ncbi:hypothetical protein L1887_02763 [Cichorium endivia]|nr:hypothetical protein L1887_02763 [Cichorium endivia]
MAGKQCGVSKSNSTNLSFVSGVTVGIPFRSVNRKHVHSNAKSSSIAGQSSCWFHIKFRVITRFIPVHQNLKNLSSKLKE